MVIVTINPNPLANYVEINSDTTAVFWEQDRFENNFPEFLRCKVVGFELEWSV